MRQIIRQLVLIVMISIGLQSTVSAEPNVSAQGSQSFMSLKSAQKMVDAVQQAAMVRDLRLVISVYDQHGQLKYFRRMDDTSVGSIQVAQLKGATSANFPVATRQLAERSASLPANPYASIPGFVLLPGGVPVFDSAGRHVGSIGVSGATPDLDEECAKIGADSYTEV
jgi:uncharacterized protein GlcG (DUF336 family)